MVGGNSGKCAFAHTRIQRKLPPCRGTGQTVPKISSRAPPSPLSSIMFEDDNRTMVGATDAHRPRRRTFSGLVLLGAKRSREASFFRLNSARILGLGMFEGIFQGPLASSPPPVSEVKAVLGGRASGKIAAIGAAADDEFECRCSGGAQGCPKAGDDGLDLHWRFHWSL